VLSVLRFGGPIKGRLKTVLQSLSREKSLKGGKSQKGEVGKTREFSLHPAGDVHRVCKGKEGARCCTGCKYLWKGGKCEKRGNQTQKKRGGEGKSPYKKKAINKTGKEVTQQPIVH